MKKKPKYDKQTAARAVAVNLLDQAAANRARILKKRRGLEDKHDLAIALLPDAKPAATPYTPPVDASQRKYVKQIRRGCCGFTHTNFINR